MKITLLFCAYIAASFSALADTLRPIYSDDVKSPPLFPFEIVCKKSVSVESANSLAEHSYPLPKALDSSVEPSIASYSTYSEFDKTDDFYVPNIRKFNIISGSMHPVIPIGSSIIVNESINFDNVKEGDIIVYKSKVFERGTNYIVHRVIRRSNNVLICKGDRNIMPDKELVFRKNFVGKVIFISKNLIGSL